MLPQDSDSHEAALLHPSSRPAPQSGSHPVVQTLPFTAKSRAMAVIRVASGNFLEMYDFMVFGYYAAGIGRAFFPTHNEYASLMLSFMTFGTGYLMRPLGAIILGTYCDRVGRRKGLLLTL